MSTFAIIKSTNILSNHIFCFHICYKAGAPNHLAFDGEAEARLIQLACSEPPAGHGHWSLRLLERKVVELGIVDAANDSAIGIQPLAGF